MAPSSTLTAALLVLSQFSHLTASSTTAHPAGQRRIEARQVHINGPSVVVDGLVTVDPAGVFAPAATVLSGGGGNVIAPGVTVNPAGVYAPAATVLSGGGGNVVAPGVAVNPSGVYAPAATVLNDGTVLAPNVTVNPSGVYAPGATVTPGEVDAPGVTVVPSGVYVSGTLVPTVTPGGGSLTTTITERGSTITTVVPNTTAAQEQTTRAKETPMPTKGAGSSSSAHNSAAVRTTSLVGVQLGLAVIGLVFAGLGPLLLFI